MVLLLHSSHQRKRVHPNNFINHLSSKYATFQSYHFVPLFLVSRIIKKAEFASNKTISRITGFPEIYCIFKKPCNKIYKYVCRFKNGFTLSGNNFDEELKCSLFIEWDKIERGGGGERGVILIRASIIGEEGGGWWGDHYPMTHLPRKITTKKYIHI